MGSVLASVRGLGGFELLVIILVAFVCLIRTAIQVVSFCRIFSKAGYSWAFGLLLLIPMAQIIVPLVLAFLDWPVCRELRTLKK